MKSPKEILEDTARKKYNGEGFDEMLYWQQSGITDCVIDAITEACSQTKSEVIEKVLEVLERNRSTADGNVYDVNNLITQIKAL